MKKQTVFTDEEMIKAIRHAVASGVNRDDIADRLSPPNLLSFFNNLPRPERDRLIAEAMKG
jgi:hypothetical protein